MKTPWILAAAMLSASILAAPILSGGHMVISGALAAPLTAPGAAPPELYNPGPQIMRIQADRMMRLRQHRSIMENALRPRREARRPEPLPPQPLPPEPQSTEPQSTEPQSTEPQTAEPQTQVSCEAAADIITDFGFSDIRPSDCSGELYRFSAMRDGTAYSIGITAGTGEIAEVSRQ